MRTCRMGMKILRWLSKRCGLGRLAASLFGLAWNLVTFLAVPILVAEGIASPTDQKSQLRGLKNV